MNNDKLESFLQPILAFLTGMLNRFKELLAKTFASVTKNSRNGISIPPKPSKPDIHFRVIFSSFWAFF